MANSRAQSGSGRAPAVRRTVYGPYAMIVGAICIALTGCQTPPAQNARSSKSSQPVPDVPVTQGRFLVGSPYQENGRWYHPVEDWTYNEVVRASWYGIDYHGKRTANGETFDLRALTAAHPTLPLPSRVRVTNIENGKSVEVRVNDRGPFVAGRTIDLSERAAEILGFKEKGTAMVRVEMLGRAPLEVFRMAAPKGPGPDLPVRAAPTSNVVAAELTALSSDAQESKAAEPAEQAAPAPQRQSAPEVESPADPVGDLISKMSAGEADETDEPGEGSAEGAAGQVLAEATREPAPRDGEQSFASAVTGKFFIQAGAFTVPENAYSLRRLIRKAIEGANVSINPAQVGNREFFRVRVGPFSSTEEANGILAQLRNLGQNEAKIISN